MAKPLFDRIAADLNPTTGRISDCRRDLLEAELERRQTEARISDAESRADDPATSDDDARLALQQAQDWRLHARRLDRAIADLKESIAAKEADESYAARRQAFAAAAAARDALADRWRAFGEAWKLLPALLADTEANDRLLAQVNQERPRATDALKSSEVVARGALHSCNWPNSVGQNGDPFIRFTTMTLPFFDKPGGMWPARQNGAHAAIERSMAESHRAIEIAKDPKAIAAARARKEALWARYEVRQQPYSGTMIKGVRHREGISGVDMEPVTLWMAEGQVVAARQRGLKVRPAPLKAPLDEPQPLEVAATI